MNYITGSSGFLGSHLTKLISDTQCIRHQDIVSTTLQPFDSFYFLSTYGNMWSHKNIGEIIKANLLDLIHVLSQLRHVPFRHFVYVSTSSVKLDYQTPYSRMKRAAEEVLLAHLEKFKLPICIVRPYSITGVGEQSEHLIPTLIRSCMTGEEVDFVPNACHDFIDVDDVASAIASLSEHCVRGIFEVGNGKKVSNHQVLQMVQAAAGKKANIHMVNDLRPYDNDDWFSTNYKVRSWGWLPKKSLEQSIKEMVDAYDN